MLDNKTRSYIIRSMVPSDKEKFMDLMKLFIDERMSEYGGIYDPQMACIQYDQIIGNKDFIGIVAQLDDELVGAVCGVVGPLLFCAGAVAQELVWYVDRDHRGSSLGIRLFKEYEHRAIKSGAFGIMMFAMGDDKANGFYLKQGFVPLQNMYIKKIGE